MTVPPRSTERPRVSATDASEVAPLGTAPPSTSELETPSVRPTGRGKFIARLGAVVALGVAGVLGVVNHRFATRAPVAVHVSTPQPPKAAAPQPLPERSPEPEPPPPEPASTTVAAPAPLPAAPVESSAAKPSNTTTVTVNVIPTAAVLFRAGQRLGSGAVEVNVEHGAKQRLTALHDGYVPYNFTVDGARETVTVRLRRAAKPQPEAATAPAADSPFEGANGAAVPSTPSLPATSGADGTPAATPSPAATSGE